MAVESGDVVLPIFEEGAVAWDDDTLAFRGEKFEDGDSIELGGTILESVDEDVTIPAECAAAERFLETQEAY